MPRSSVLRGARPGAGVAFLVLVGSVVACGAVRGRRGEAPQSGFLRDYSKLEHREGYEAQEIYVNPAASWSQYDAVDLDSVTLWATAEGAKLSPDEQKMLADLLYTALHDELGKQFTLASGAGPSVLRVRAALTQAKGANVPMRTISTLVPQMLLLSTAVGLSADAATTVGAAVIEMEAVDSITGERLAAAVDSRAGTKRLFTTRTFSKWGDVEAACRYWAERAAGFLVRAGVRTKAGASGS